MFDDFIIGPQSDEFYDEQQKFEDEEYIATLAYRKQKRREKMRQAAMYRFDDYYHGDDDEHDTYFPKYDW
jgi:hypothetical protein